MIRRAVPRPRAARVTLGCLVATVATAALATASPAAASAPDARVAGAAAATITTRATVAADTEAARTPLRVTISTLAPATIPRTGRLSVTGLITNRSQDTWTDLNVYLVTSPTPLLSRGQLARAAATPAEAQVGERIARAGLYQRVADLSPGSSVRYRLSVPASDLQISGRPGVYWVGVHVLGANPTGRDSIADGRARTFVPLLPRAGTTAAARDQTRLSLLVPLRASVQRGAEGRLLDLARWRRTVTRDGRLDRLLRLASHVRAGQRFTWVVDPAVLDAVQSVADDDPPLDTGPTGSAAASGSATPTPTPSSSASPSGSADTGADSTAGSVTSVAAGRARGWLQRFRRQASQQAVSTVPYGDQDVAAVLDSPQQSLYARATALSSATMTRLGLPGASALVDPPGGALPGAVLQGLDPSTPVVLDQTALPDADGPVVGRTGRTPIVLTDPEAGSGGPAPNSPYAALEVRQRLLSDAALHAMSADRAQPLVVTLPTHWDPGNAWLGSQFFTALDQPWLQLVDLPTVAAGLPASTADSDQPVYPDSERRAQLPSANLEASAALVRAGGIFARLLADNDTVDDQLDRYAMLGASLDARAAPAAARARTAATSAYVRSQMTQVHIVGPPFVMMSGEAGPIQVTLVNDLAQTVTAGLSVSTRGSDLTISRVPPVTLGPGRRTSIRLEAHSTDIGVHAVTLRVTDAEGALLGSRTQLNVRTSHVDTVIWVIMAGGATLLFLAIAVRLFRRVRRRRATHGPLLPSDSVAAGPGSA